MVDKDLCDEMCRLWGTSSLPDIRTNLTCSNYMFKAQPRHANQFSVQEGNIIPIARPVITELLGQPLQRGKASGFMSHLESQSQLQKKWAKIETLQKALHLREKQRYNDVKSILEEYAKNYQMTQQQKQSYNDSLHEMTTQKEVVTSVLLVTKATEQQDARNEQKMTEKFEKDFKKLESDLKTKLWNYDYDFNAYRIRTLQQIFDLRNSEVMMQFQSIEEDLYYFVYGDETSRRRAEEEGNCSCGSKDDCSASSQTENDQLDHFTDEKGELLENSEAFIIERDSADEELDVGFM